MDRAFVYADPLGYLGEGEIRLVLIKTQKDIECSFDRTYGLCHLKLLLKGWTVNCG